MWDTKPELKLRTISWYVERVTFTPRLEPFCEWQPVRIGERLNGIKIRIGNRRIGVFYL